MTRWRRPNSMESSWRTHRPPSFIRPSEILWERLTSQLAGILSLIEQVWVVPLLTLEIVLQSMSHLAMALLCPSISKELAFSSLALQSRHLFKSLSTVSYRGILWQTHPTRHSSMSKTFRMLITPLYSPPILSCPLSTQHSPLSYLTRPSYSYPHQYPQKISLSDLLTIILSHFRVHGTIPCKSTNLPARGTVPKHHSTELPFNSLEMFHH